MTTTTHPVLAQLAEKRAALIADMRSTLNTAQDRSGGATVEDEAKLRALDDDLVALDERITAVTGAVKRSEEMDPEIRAALDGQPTSLSDASSSTCWLPTRSEFAQLATRALDSTDTVPMLTTAQAAEFSDRLRARSVVLASGVRVVDIPEGHQTLRMAKIDTSATISMVAEGASIPEGDPTFGSVTLGPKKLAALVLASNESLTDTTPSLRAMTADDMVKAVATTLDGQLLNGDGTGANMTGLTVMAGVTEQSLGANGDTPTLDDFADALETLESANADRSEMVAYMAPRTWSTLRKIKDADGRYIVNPTPTSGEPPTLFGVPVYATTNLPVDLTVGTSDDCSTIVIADRTQVVVGRRKEVEIAYSTDYAFNADQTAIRVVARYDVQPINAAGVLKITGVRP